MLAIELESTGLLPRPVLDAAQHFGLHVVMKQLEVVMKQLERAAVDEGADRPDHSPDEWHPECEAFEPAATRSCDKRVRDPLAAGSSISHSPATRRRGGSIILTGTVLKREQGTRSPTRSSYRSGWILAAERPSPQVTNNRRSTQSRLPTDCRGLMLACFVHSPTRYRRSYSPGRQTARPLHCGPSVTRDDHARVVKGQRDLPGGGQ